MSQPPKNSKKFNEINTLHSIGGAFLALPARASAGREEGDTPKEVSQNPPAEPSWERAGAQNTDLASISPTALGLPAQLLQRDLETAAQLRAVSGLAPNTEAAYAADWGRFQKWLGARALVVAQVTPAIVELHLGFLAAKGIVTGSVERAYAGISHHMKVLGDWPLRRPENIRRFFDKLSRAAPPNPQGKKPVLGEMLARMLPLAGKGLEGARNRALLLFAWTGALRRVEATSTRVEWMAFEKDGATLTLPKSKANQAGPPEEVFIPREGGALCPVAALETWLRASKITAGPLFRIVYHPPGHAEVLGKDAPDPRLVANVVKRCIAALGENPDDYAGHSLRRGFMTTGALEGLTVDEMMPHSRHKSRVQAQGYVDRVAMKKRAPARGLLKKNAVAAGVTIDAPTTLLDAMGKVRAPEEQKLTRVKRKR